MTDLQVEKDLLRHFEFTLGRDEQGKSRFYLYTALALTIRDRLVERWSKTRQSHNEKRSTPNPS